MIRIGNLSFLALALAAVGPAHARFEAGYAHVDEIDGQTSHSLIGSWLRPIERWKAHDVHS